VKILLRKDRVESDKLDDHGRTPVSTCVWIRCEGGVLNIILG